MSAAPSIGVQPAFAFTRHAVRRFMERVCVTADHRDALRVLADAADQAVLLPRRTRFGQAIWRIESPAMRWITKPDAGTTVVVTVLDAADGSEDEAEQEVLEAHKRLASIAPDLVTSTRPTARPKCCAGHAATWLDLEAKRLEVERRRIEAIAAADANATKQAEAKRDTARAKLERVQAQAQCQTASVEAKKVKQENARQHAARDVDEQVRYRNSLLRAAAKRLRSIDAEGSADLLAKIDDVLRAEERKDSKRGAA